MSSTDKILLSLSSFIFILCIISLPATAQNSKFGTRAEAIKMAKDVIRYHRSRGEKAMIRIILEQKRFRDRDLYPFVIDMNGIMVAHGALRALVGKNVYPLQDKDGKLLVKEFVRLMKTQRSGWVDYKWPNFVTGKVDQKSSYLERINNEYFVGVGIYLGTSQ